MAVAFRNQLSQKKLIKAYTKGIRELEIEYMRVMEDQSVIWVCTKSKLLTDPDTQDIMCFMYTYNIDQEKTMRLIVEHVSESEFDMMGLIYVDQCLIHCVRASEMEENMECGVDVDYRVGMDEFVSKYVHRGDREDISRKLQIDTILQELEVKDSYVITEAVRYQKKNYYKKWEFSYLDESHERIILIRSDVTELFAQQERQRENLRDALMQAEQASRAKIDFLSNMSHEIRTPMNAIIGMSALAAQNNDNPQEVSECISKVGISARFLLSLINDILDMSRIESGKVSLKKEEFPFEDLINNVNSIIYNQAEAKGVDYECIVTSFTELNYMGDAMKLQQVFINLLGNAVKFTPAGGKTQFIVHQNKIENGKAHFNFTINDTGIGISEDFQKRMFQPFEREDHKATTTYQGTGLGLAISKNLVDMMGGSIQVNSIEGVGT